MKRTTIVLPDELASVVQHEADRRGTSVSDVIRESIVQVYLSGKRREIPFAGIIDDPSLPPASKLDESLEGWIDDLSRRR